MMLVLRLALEAKFCGLGQKFKAIFYQVNISRSRSSPTTMGIRS